MSLASLIEIATNEKQTEDDWTKILDVCEKGTSNSKECLRLIMRRLFHRNPHIALRSIILLDACVQNIGEPFTRELSSRYFVNEIKSKSKNIHQKAVERLCCMMKKWSRELTGSEYDCINELNKWLQDNYPVAYAAGDDELNSRNSNKSSRKIIGGQEEEDLAKAIALSLKDSEQKRSNLYPSSNMMGSVSGPVKSVIETVVPSKKQLAKVRALYDFEAAEDNELTFKAGEIIIDVDTSNEHWWYGSNHRGQGMFPAQFVTIDVDNEIEKGSDLNKGANEKSSIHFNQPIDSFPARPPTPVIDESKVDECLLLIEDADPTGEMRPDPPELSKLEAQCRVMGPLIDQELEKVDRHYNMLVELNRKTIESFQLYSELMTQGGMGRSFNYMWPQNAHQAMPPSQYMNMNLPPPHQSLPHDVSPQILASRMTMGVNDNINPNARHSIPDPTLFQTMNFYGTAATPSIGPNQDMTMFGAQHFPMNKSQHQIPPSTTGPPSINHKPAGGFPHSNNNSNTNNNAMSYQGYPDVNMRSLPGQSTVIPDTSFQQSTNLNHSHFSYVTNSNDQTFPASDGFR